MRRRGKAGSWLVVLVLVAGFGGAATAASPQLVVRPGQPFPDLRFGSLLGRAEGV